MIGALISLVECEMGERRAWKRDGPSSFKDGVGDRRGGDVLEMGRFGTRQRWMGDLNLRWPDDGTMDGYENGERREEREREWTYGDSEL